MNGYQVDNGIEVSSTKDKQLLETAAIIAKVITDLNAASDTSEKGNLSALANAFAKVVAKGKDSWLDSSTKSTWVPGQQGKKGHWEIDIDPAGYYLILDTHVSSDSDTESVQSAISEYMLAVFGQQTINMKSSIPTITKDIVLKDTSGTEIGTTKRDNVSTGDVVSFRVTSTLPENFKNYTEYYYLLHDKMSKGLELIKSSVSVQIRNGEDWYEIALGNDHCCRTE